MCCSLNLPHHVSDIKFLSDEDRFHYHEQIRGSSYKILLFAGSHGCSLCISVTLRCLGDLWQFMLIILKPQPPVQEI
jgi:hypothetical protein